MKEKNVNKLWIEKKISEFSHFLVAKPDLPARTVLKTIFRKSQVRVIADKYGINLNCQIVSLAAKQWECCFWKCWREFLKKPSLLIVSWLESDSVKQNYFFTESRLTVNTPFSH